MRFLICKNCGEKIEADKFKELCGFDISSSHDVAEIYKEKMGVQEVNDATVRDLQERYAAIVGMTKKTEVSAQCPKCNAGMKFICFDFMM